MLQGVRTLVLEEGVAYKECARTPAVPRYQEFNVHKDGAFTDNASHKVLLMILKTTE